MRKRKIFFAIPFDTLTKSFYKQIIKNINKEIENLECVIGNELLPETKDTPKLDFFQIKLVNNPTQISVYKHRAF